MTSWLEVCITTEEADSVEAVAALLQLFAIGDEGVAIEQSGDQANLDPRALLPETAVKLYVDADRDSAEFRHSITTAAAAHSFPAPSYQLIHEQDWANAWKENFKPLRVGKRFWIRPNWINEPSPEVDDIILSLDPGMAFGTGKHETTQLCLALIETHLKPGMSVLDVGAGSGILAVGAAKLGAAPILAFDNDPLADEATRANAADNNVTPLIESRVATLADIPVSQWDMVVVNILAPVIKQLLSNDHLLAYVKPDGYLILSGILGTQSAEMTDAIISAGGVVESTHHDGDWMAFVARVHNH